MFTPLDIPLVYDNVITATNNIFINILNIWGFCWKSITKVQT